MQRFIRLPALAALALSLAGCGGAKETYQAPVSETWSKVSSSAYAAAAFGVPVGLLGADVRASFESFPGERTGYWKFSRKGKELGRLNVAVEGDAESSTVSYNYASGDVAAADQKAEKLVRQFGQPLIVEAIDSTIEGRARDDQLRRQADAQSTTAMMGQLFNDVDKSMNAAVARFDEQERDRKRRDANAAVNKARANAAKPMVSLGGN